MNGMDPMNRSKGKVSPNTSKKPINRIGNLAKPTGIKKASPLRPKTSRGPRVVTTLTKSRGPIRMGDSSSVLQHSVPELSDFIEKDEFVADVVGSGGTSSITITQYPFNPGQSLLFPLGSAEASKWTNWECVYAEPYLLHEVSAFATDGSTGKVILAFDYNAANNIATTKQQLEDMHSASCMPCEDVGLSLVPKLLNRADPKYVRTGSQPSNTDIRLYDGGNLYVAASGQAGTSKVSELRIRYKFRMQLPTLLNPGSGSSVALGAAFEIASPVAGEAAAATTVYVAQFASSTNPTVIQNGIGATIASTGLITLPAGVYKLECGNMGSDTAANVTVTTAQFCASATASTSIVYEFSGGTTTTTTTISGHECSFIEIAPWIWSTALLGTVISFQVAQTYASGTCLNNSWLKITAV